MLCTSCNLEYPEYLNFCRRCGKPLVHSTAETVVESHCCTRCGARVARGENFCQQCGNRLNARTTETVIGACHHCGTSWRSGWLFCRNCGLDRDRALMPRVSAPVPAGSPRAEVIAALEEYLKIDKIFCPKCGVEAKPYSKFCETCGMTLDQAEAEGKPGSAPSDAPTLIGEIEEDEAIAEAVTVKEDTIPAVRQMRTRPDKEAPLTTDAPRGRRTELIEEADETVAMPPDEGASEVDSSEAEPVVAPPERKVEAAPPTMPGEEQRKKTNRSAIQTLGILAAVIIVMVGAYGWWMSRRPAKTGDAQSAPVALPAPETAKSAAPAGMIFIPGGRFTMGRDDGDEFERPAFTSTVKPFFIDRTEVTNEDYLKFIEATGYRAPSNWQNGRFPDGQGKLPVINVSWDDASEYAKWAGKRLPKEDEWEYAARGEDGRKYPWGSGWSVGKANASNIGGAIREVGSFPEGASPFGVLDMSGNVWEWIDSDLRSYANRNQRLAEGKVIRGGAFDVPAERATTTYRGVVPPDKYYDKTGFRCARDADQSAAN